MSWYLYLAPLEGQNIILIFINLWVFYFLEKYDGLSDLVPYFTDQNENTFEKWGAHENEF